MANTVCINCLQTYKDVQKAYKTLKNVLILFSVFV